MEQFVFPTVHGSARGGRGGGTYLFFQFPMAVTQAHGIQVN